MIREDKARSAAIEAITKYEQSTDNKLSDADRKLLDRCRSEKWASKVGSAWLQIQKHLKLTEDGQFVIGDIIRAMRFATTSSKLRATWKKRMKNVEEVQKAIAVLRRFMAENPSLFLGLLAKEPKERLTSSLSWLRECLDAQVQVIEFNRRAISRKSGSVSGQRVMFAVHMVWTMRWRFGTPCYAAVANLTSIAFKKHFDITQASDAWRDHPMPVPPLNEPVHIPPRSPRIVGRRRSKTTS